MWLRPRGPRERVRELWTRRWCCDLIFLWGGGSGSTPRLGAASPAGMWGGSCGSRSAWCCSPASEQQPPSIYGAPQTCVGTSGSPVGSGRVLGAGAEPPRTALNPPQCVRGADPTVIWGWERQHLGLARCPHCSPHILSHLGGGLGWSSRAPKPMGLPPGGPGAAAAPPLLGLVSRLRARHGAGGACRGESHIFGDPGGVAVPP